MSVHVYSVQYDGRGLRLDARSMVMNPTEAHQIRVDVVARPSTENGIDLMVAMAVDRQSSDYTVMHRQIWTPDQLADVYELAHHKLHGVDDRGLDPREGPTRLTIRQSDRAGTLPSAWSAAYGEPIRRDGLGRLVGTRTGTVYQA